MLSPYPPEHAGQPVAVPGAERGGRGLADAVVVVEAPARSGALNTACGQPAGVPVLAVPGDVDRRHVAGCLALIRDGATLARNAGDVLEALGRAASRCRSTAGPGRPARPRMPVALLAALDAGAHQLDELVAATGIEAAAVLAAATVLELDGIDRVRRRPAGLRSL